MAGPYLRHLKRSLNACAGSPSKGVGNYKPSYYSCGEAGGSYYSWNDKYGSSSDDSGSSYSYSGGGDGDYTIVWIILGVMFGIPLCLWMCVGIQYLWENADLWGKYKHRRHMRKFNENFRKNQESSKPDGPSKSETVASDTAYLYVGHPKGEIPTANDVVSGFNCNAKDQPANKLYWSLILASRDAFNGTKDGKQKQEIVESIQDAIAAKNGRFLHREPKTMCWLVLPPNKVQSKIRQGLHPKASVPKYHFSSEDIKQYHKKDGVPEPDETTQSSSTTSASDMSYLPNGKVPTDNDVLSGSNSNAKTQPANKLYWELILASRETFNDTNDRTEKQEIVESIQDAIASKNGRFLHRDGNTRRWVVLPPNKVQFKIRQALNPRAAVPKYAMNSAEKTPEYGVGAGTFLFQVAPTDNAQSTLSSIDLEAQTEESLQSSATIDEPTAVGDTRVSKARGQDVTKDNVSNETRPSLFETVYSGFIKIMNENPSNQKHDAENP